MSAIASFLLTAALPTGLLVLWRIGVIWLRIVLILTLIAIVVGAWTVVLSGRIDTLGPEAPWYDSGPWRGVILFVLMVLGMFARVISVAIKARQASQAMPRPPVRIDIWDLLYPLPTSVITFGGVLSAVGDKALDWGIVVLAFQNGFFWQTLLKPGISTGD